MLRLAAAVVAASVGIALLLGNAVPAGGPAERQVATPAGQMLRGAEPPTRLDLRTVPAGSPRWVRIPAIKVDAPVVPVRMEGGTLDPPDDPRVVGWWSGGARPGSATGTALLTAHTVHTGGGAFDALGRLTPGARFTVGTTTGTRAYVVQSVELLGKGRLAQRAAVLFDQSVPGRVALVTCADWDGRQYLSNTVVLATPVR